MPTEMPTIFLTNSNANTYTATGGTWEDASNRTAVAEAVYKHQQYQKDMQRLEDTLSIKAGGVASLSIKQENQDMRRIVQVFIVDTNESVPLKDSLLHQGNVHLTDSTDQELYFEIDIKKLLDEHNIKRVKIQDKESTNKSKKLEKARIRDLSMVVNEITRFE